MPATHAAPRADDDPNGPAIPKIPTQRPPSEPKTRITFPIHADRAFGDAA